MLVGHMFRKSTAAGPRLGTSGLSWDSLVRGLFRPLPARKGRSLSHLSAGKETPAPARGSPAGTSLAELVRFLGTVAMTHTTHPWVVTGKALGIRPACGRRGGRPRWLLLTAGDHG